YRFIDEEREHLVIKIPASMFAQYRRNTASLMYRVTFEGLPMEVVWKILGYVPQAALNLRLVSRAVKRHVDQFAVQFASIPTFDKFTLSSWNNGLFSQVCFDIAHAPLSVLAWKYRALESGNYTCTSFHLKSGTFQYIFKWDKTDSDLHTKMISLMRDYMCNGTIRAGLDGNDF
ncbi:hypothetical protein PMAYCL1PPCAC_31613, partial [Pristionchus mayeri]